MDDRSRRIFVMLASALAARPVDVLAQGSTRIRRIGIIEPGTRPLTPAEAQEELAALQALGWIQGQNLQAEWRIWDGRIELLGPLIEGLVHEKVDVIVTIGPNPTRAAMRATSTIPIVFFAADPIDMGLVTTLARPSGNVTGLSGASSEGVVKLVSLLKEVIPNLRRFGVVDNAANPQHRQSRRRMDDMVHSLGLEPVFVEVTGPEDIDSVVAQLADRQARALLLRPDSFAAAHGPRLIEAALKRGLPTVSESNAFVRRGALISYGVSGAGVTRRLAYYVDRLLRGARPADLPVEQPTEFDLVLNARTAATLGITFPQSVLVLATNVVQ